MTDRRGIDAARIGASLSGGVFLPARANRRPGASVRLSLSGLADG